MLDAIQAEQVNMSIWLRSDGLTFAQSYPQDLSQGEGLSRGSFDFARGYASITEPLEELLYTQPELGLPYRRVRLALSPLASVLVPNALYQTEEQAGWMKLVLGEDYQGQSYHICAYPLEDEGKQLIFAVPAELYSLLARTYLQLELIPYYIPLLEGRKLASRSTEGRELTLMMSREGLEVFVLEAGQLSLLNAYRWMRQGDEEAILGELSFYVFALWRSLGLSPEADRLLLCHNSEDGEGIALAQRAQDLLSARLPHCSILTFNSTDILCVS